MSRLVLPVHIVIFGPTQIEKDIVNKLQKLQKDSKITSISNNVKEILQLNFLGGRIVLDRVVSQGKIDNNSNSQIANQRADIRRAYARVYSDYEKYESLGREIYKPEIILILNVLPTDDVEWNTELDKLRNKGVFIEAFWLNSMPVSDNKKDGLHKFLYRLVDKDNNRGQYQQRLYSGEESTKSKIVSDIYLSLLKRIVNNTKGLVSLKKNKLNTSESEVISSLQFDAKQFNLVDEQKAEIPFAPSIPPASAEWKIIEPPINLGDRVPHTFCDSRYDENDWCILVASKRGRLHENEGTFREDATKNEITNGWLLSAVADGAGSHHLSRVGSNLAAKASIEAMKAAVEKTQPDMSVAKVALQDALQKSWQALFEEAEKRKSNGVTFKDLSTTLLLLMYHPLLRIIGVAQVGDGLIASQLENDQINLLGNPESGEYSGQTYFLTNYKKQDLLSKVIVLDEPHPAKLIFVMTDGVADDLYPPLERLPGLIKPMSGVLASPHPDEALLELISYNRPGSFDDRTLAVVCKCNSVTSSSVFNGTNKKPDLKSNW